MTSSHPQYFLGIWHRETGCAPGLDQTNSTIDVSQCTLRCERKIETLIEKQGKYCNQDVVFDAFRGEAKAFFTKATASEYLDSENRF